MQRPEVSAFWLSDSVSLTKYHWPTHIQLGQRCSDSMSTSSPWHQLPPHPSWQLWFLPVTLPWALWLNLHWLSTDNINEGLQALFYVQYLSVANSTATAHTLIILQVQGSSWVPFIVCSILTTSGGRFISHHTLGFAKWGNWLREISHLSKFLGINRTGTPAQGVSSRCTPYSSVVISRGS